MAEAYLLLAVKSVGQSNSPIQFNGGQLHDLYKDKGSPQHPFEASYRDSLLADETGKKLQSTNRAVLNELTVAATTDTQMGVWSTQRLDRSRSFIHEELF